MKAKGFYRSLSGVVYAIDLVGGIHYIIDLINYEIYLVPTPFNDVLETYVEAEEGDVIIAVQKVTSHINSIFK